MLCLLKSDLQIVLTPVCRIACISGLKQRGLGFAAVFFFIFFTYLKYDVTNEPRAAGRGRHDDTDSFLFS